MNPTVQLSETLCATLGQHAMQAHRGAFSIDGLHVVFGNDGDRGRVAAALATEAVIQHGAVNYILATADATWVILFTSTKLTVDALIDIVWDAWADVCGGRTEMFNHFEVMQRSIAQDAIRDAWERIVAVVHKPSAKQ